ncbi:hypothetical protein DM01DRAFT_1403187 [Hesseltinella vesiculosa]|uniref:Reverse transcriptase RNase H-like domain-containing protein n=1 Tax=Hesseltinella vesiculosa TaxID=101127 RepID=A0A1X2GXH6_9FUNG|nr:hypothetical protein DM01DRAFT_1403187 [Hesseltinella vesiculosa]
MYKAILLQSPDGQSGADEQGITHAFRTLKDTESHCALTHLEALAIIWATNPFQHYLLGKDELIAVFELVLQQHRLPIDSHRERCLITSAKNSSNKVPWYKNFNTKASTGHKPNVCAHGTR